MLLWARVYMTEPKSKDVQPNYRDGRPMGHAFEVDGRIVVKIDHDLAISLGSLILSTDTKNPAMLALGHQLRSFADGYVSS